MKQTWVNYFQNMFTMSEHANLRQEGLSDIAGDSTILSANESPIDSPFRLDAIICDSTSNGQLRKQYSREKIDRLFNTVS
jgi:hypothetical protein